MAKIRFVESIIYFEENSLQKFLSILLLLFCEVMPGIRIKLFFSILRNESEGLINNFSKFIKLSKVFILVMKKGVSNLEFSKNYLNLSQS